MLICCFPAGWIQFGFNMILHGLSLSSFVWCFSRLEDDNPQICWFHVCDVVFWSHGVRFLLFILECYQVL